MLKFIAYIIAANIVGIPMIISISSIVINITSLHREVSNEYQFAYQRSYDIARAEGYESGYEEQYKLGHNVGYETGVDEGYQRGYEEGYPIGEADGYKDGHEIGYSMGFEDGRDNGYNDGYKLGLADGETDGELAKVDLRIPSYSEVLAFIRRDKTDSNKYDEWYYNCSDYSAGVVNNAKAQGLKAGFVVLNYPGNIADHTIVAFDTADEGVVYFEPQSDEKANPVIGRRWYLCIVPNSPDYYYLPPLYDDTITAIEIIW